MKSCVAILCIFLTTAAVVVHSKIVQFHDCKSAFTLHSVDVSPCDSPAGETYCPLKRGTQTVMTYNFTATKDVEQVETQIQGIMGSIVAPFPMKNPNACLESNLNCPLQTGQTYTYIHGVDVLEAYPKVSVLIRWMLKDKNAQTDGGDKKHLVCFIVKAKIVDEAGGEATVATSAD